MGIAKYINSYTALNFSGALVITLVGALSIFIVSGSNLWPTVSALSIALLICFTVFVLISKSARNLLMLLFWAEAILITVLYFLVDSDFLAILSIVWIVQAAELYGPRQASWLLVASIGVFAASQLYHVEDSGIVAALINATLFGLFQVFALSAVQRAINERQLREETAALNRELVATRDLLSQSTAQSERLRIARNLHDILGHHMTALILNLEVAKHVAQGKAQEKIEQSLAVAKLLLGDIRSAVSELRDDDEIDLQKSINSLTADLPKLTFDVDLSEAPAIKNVKLAETLLRCIQEAITNVLRHSTATKCRIELAAKGNKCLLTVSDNGHFNKKITLGNGLKGMSERISANGGELSWQQSDNGFTLHAALLTEPVL